MSATKSLVVSVHDVAPPQWGQVRAMLDRLAAVGVRRRSLLVVPNFHGHSPIDEREDFCGWLCERQRDGDEIVLHGFEHLEVCPPRGVTARFKNRWFTQGEGEFLSLDYARARARIERGLAMMGQAGLDVQGFVAPAWLINRHGVKAAGDCGLQYTNSYLTFSDLRNGWTRFAPSLVFGPGHLNEDVGIRLQGGMFRAVAVSPVVRIALHPPCIEHPARWERIVAVVERHARDREAITYAQLLEQWRTRSAADQRLPDQAARRKVVGDR